MADNEELKSKLPFGESAKEVGDQLDALQKKLGEKTPEEIQKTIDAAKAADEAAKKQRKEMRSKIKQTFANPVFPKSSPATAPAGSPERLQQLKEAAQKLKADEPARQERIAAMKNRAPQSKSNILELPKTTVKSTAEQLQELQLKNLKRQQQRESSSIFRLPDIPKDTATSIVIASLVATFFILAGIGTKFSQLWGYAFNAPISSVGNQQQNQDITTAASNLQGLENTTGSGSGDEAWGIPDIYHMIYDAGDAGVTLDEERTA